MKTKVILSVLAGILAVVALWWVIFGAKVLASDPIGQGNATITENSAENRLAAEREWASSYEEVVSADKNLTSLGLDKDAEPGKTRYIGAVNYCNSVVAEYDKLADSPLTQKFQPEGYPTKINPNDPSTDCKE